MVSIERLTFHYPGKEIFKDFSWRIEPGEAWAVLGPSGCGKSTLLALMAGLRRPVSGRILVHGFPLQRPRPHTGLILQDHGLLPWATVRQNIELGLKIRRFYGADGIHAPLENKPGPSIDYWLDRLGLTAVADNYPVQLSGGQRQRTAIARTLVLNPDLLLMDEPFSSLDAPTRESLQHLTWELISEQGLTLVLVTHSLEEAAFMGRKILLLTAPPVSGMILQNDPKAGTKGFRTAEAYTAMCLTLRKRMEQLAGWNQEDG